MLSDRVRERLEQLNRTALPARSKTNALQRSLTPNSSCKTTISPNHNSYLPSGSGVGTPYGEHWLIQQPLEQLWSRGPKLIEQTTRFENPIVEERDRDLFQLECSFPHRILWLDLETCGFAGSMVFLAGVMHLECGGIVLTQLWARNYAEEKALLHTLWTLVQRSDLLMTFNGKSFDWPQVQDRSTLHHLGTSCSGTERIQELRYEPLYLDAHSDRPGIGHFDLLHHARRRWKTQLPNCKLQTLERYICGRNRVGDIPGRDIPLAYHDYVRTGNTEQVRSILHHNALDLVTLLQLSLTFIGYEPCADARVAS